MSTLKNRYYNIFLEHTFIILSILLLSLIPWIEFINSNYEQIENIFNDNFIILIFLYLIIVIFIYFFTLFLFKKKSKLFYVSLVSISIWIFFQFNLIKTQFNNILTGYYIWHISSEIALFVVIILIIFLTFILNKNNNWRQFIIFFLIFNFVYSSVVLFPKLKEFNSKINKLDLKENDQTNLFSNIQKKPNIYFFLSDAMMSLDKFEEFYDLKLDKFEELYKSNNYSYYKETLNTYEWTEPVMTSFFFLEENIYTSESNETNRILKPQIYKLFPSLLKDGYIPPLIKELNNLDYKFKWVGNYSQNCSNTNYKYCLNNKKKNYIDKYTLQAFLNKSPIVQIFDNLIQLEIVNKYIDLKILHSDAVWEIDNYITINNEYIKDMDPTFFFIHEVEAHEPYFVDSNCKDKRFVGKFNLEGYKNSYLCVIKKFSKVIKTIEKFDPNSLVVFQADHSWIMSTQSEEKFGKRNNIFNLIKNNVICNNPMPNNPNNTNIAKYIINCLKIKNNT